MTQKNQSAPPGGKKSLKWTLASVLIAALSIWAVTSQWKNFSLGEFIDYVSRANKPWLAAACMGTAGFVFFEACALKSACRALHYPAGLGHSCGYAAADIYFSAITPSASGGQPACAFLMMRDGIPGIVTTAVLLLTLSMYALSILAIGVLCAVLRPEVLTSFGTPSKVLIGVGFVAQIGLAILFLMLLKSERLLERLCRWTISFLGRLHILRHPEQRLEKLETTMDEYRRCIALLSGHRGLMVTSFLYNFLQRAALISVSMFTYLAMGGNFRLALNVFAMQGFVVIGSNCVPIPGAMGVADYLMLDGFNAFLSPDQVISMELLSRSISFYSCVLLCGVLFLIATTRQRKAGGQ